MPDHQRGSTAPDLATDLLEVLRRRLSRPDLDYAEPPTPLSGGFWAEIMAVRFTGAPPELSGDLVARVMPDDLMGRRETVVQREVALQGFPAPVVRLAGSSTDGLGRPFMIMDRSPGVPLLSGLDARAVFSLPRVIRRLPRLLASTALQLHLLDAERVAEALHREVPGAPIGPADQLARLSTAARDLGDRDLMTTTDWLAARLPVVEHPTVCHADLHPFNLLVGPGTRVTLVDWTASLIAEPECDLAFTTLMVREVPIHVPAAITPVLRRAARALVRDVLSTYRKLAAPHGITLDDDRLAWYGALHSCRALTDVVTWERSGQLDLHPGHPFILMAPSLREHLTALTSGVR